MGDPGESKSAVRVGVTLKCIVFQFQREKSQGGKKEGGEKQRPRGGA